MPIVEMKKLHLLAHREERERIMEILQRSGSLELVNVQDSPEWEAMEPLVEPDQPGDQASPLEARLDEVRYSLGFLQRYYPEKKGLVQQFIGSKINLTAAEFQDYIARQETVSAVCAACREAEQQMVQIRNEEVRCGSLLSGLSPWSPLELPLEEIRSTDWSRTWLTVVPAEKLEIFQEALLEKARDCYCEVIFRDKDQVFCLLVCLLADEPVVQEICKSVGANEANFPGVSGTPGEAIDDIQRLLQGLEEKKSAVMARVEQLLIHRPLLMAHYDYLQNESAKQEAAANLARTKAAFYLHGWIPAPALPALTADLEKGTDTAMVVVRDPGAEEEFPILLHNRGPMEAHQAVTMLYGLPSKNSLDPTPLMTPFFLLFFGICLSDVCYGLLLSLAAFVMNRKLKLAGMGRQLVNLLFWGGMSAMIFGVLLGGWFGDLIPIRPLWFAPLDDPMRMMIYSFILGIIQIYFGMAIQAYRSIKDGKFWDALFDQGGWYLFLTGLIILFLPGAGEIGKWIAIVGGLMLVLTQGRSQKNPVRKLLSGLLSLYDVTGYLSDVLSYSRLLALALATGVIASAINAMGGLLAGSIVGALLMVVLLAGGHLFNLIISTLSAYVHTSRLQYIEFFSKFFESGGRAFRPFQIKTKFVDVEEREAC